MNSKHPVRGSSGGPEKPGATRLDRIACSGCGRFFATHDGVGMLTMIKGSCPECGGRFELASAADPRPADARLHGRSPALGAVLKARRGLGRSRAFGPTRP